MNLYQHLFVIIPSVVFAYWGFYAKESTGTVVFSLIGILTLVTYLGIFIGNALVTAFKFLGTFKFIT